MKIFVLFFLLIGFSLVSAAQNNVDEALAYQYYQQADYDKAAVLLEELFNKTHSDSYFELYFNSLIKIKKYKETEILLKRLIKKYPDKSQYVVALGRVYQETGKATEANKIYLESINNLPKNENKIRQLANDFYRFEAFDMVVNVFIQGRKLLENDQLFTFELISIYRYKRNKIMLIQEYINILSTTPQMLLQAQNNLAVIFEDKSDYQLLQTALLKKIQKEPQLEVFTDMLIWQFIQQGEYELALRQLIAQDKRTNSDGLNVYQAANNFVANQAYATAIKAYEYILTKDKTIAIYIPAKIGLINAKYELATNKQFDKQKIEALAIEYQEILTTYGKTPQTLFALKKLANLQAYHLNDLEKAEETLSLGLKINGLPQTEIAQIKLDLGDIYVLSKQPWEAILIYEQVAKQFEGQAMGSEARYRSAKLNFYMGNFGYAKSQADVLKSSTSSLIANDALNLSLLISDNLLNKNDSLTLIKYAEADLLKFMNKPEEALNKLDSIPVLFPVNSLSDDILMTKANIFISKNDLTNGVAALKEIIANHKTSIWIDDALFMVAEILERKLDKPEEAKILYQQLINDYPGSMLSTEARKRFRSIRGDNVGT